MLYTGEPTQRSHSYVIYRGTTQRSQARDVKFVYIRLLLQRGRERKWGKEMEKGNGERGKGIGEGRERNRKKGKEEREVILLGEGIAKKRSQWSVVDMPERLFRIGKRFNCCSKNMHNETIGPSLQSEKERGLGLNFIWIDFSGRPKETCPSTPPAPF